MKTNTVLFEKNKITVINGKRKGNHNYYVLDDVKKEFAKEVRIFLKNPTWQGLAWIMNYPHQDEKKLLSHSAEIYNKFFFLLHLVWALDKQVIVKGVG